jgi:hypothetical protein
MCRKVAGSVVTYFLVKIRYSAHALCALNGFEWPGYFEVPLIETTNPNLMAVLA